jgi:translation initiation factor IF-1
MSTDGVVRKEGLVTEALPGATFRVQLDDDESVVLCHLSGKMRMHRIRIIEGDRVIVEMPPTGGDRGRIVFRK